MKPLPKYSSLQKVERKCGFIHLVVDNLSFLHVVLPTLERRGESITILNFQKSLLCGRRTEAAV